MLVEKIDKPSKNIVFVYTTCAGYEEARTIGLKAIEARLAVCADSWEINSIYPWQGVIEEVAQYMLMLTTEESNSQELVSFVETHHSYETPMIAQLTTAFINPAYKLWAEFTLESKK